MKRFALVLLCTMLVGCARHDKPIPPKPSDAVKFVVPARSGEYISSDGSPQKPSTAKDIYYAGEVKPIHSAKKLKDQYYGCQLPPGMSLCPEECNSCSGGGSGITGTVPIVIFVEPVSSGAITFSSSTSSTSQWTNQCSSSINLAEGWKSNQSAPRDGTVIEIAETYGIAPWYGIFKFADGRWQKIGDPDSGVSEDNCIYWRPYKGNSTTYVDPTGGAQNSIKYWCDSMHLAYDPKQDKCISH